MSGLSVPELSRMCRAPTATTFRISPNPYVAREMSNVGRPSLIRFGLSVADIHDQKQLSQHGMLKIQQIF